MADFGRTVRGKLKSPRTPRTPKGGTPGRYNPYKIPRREIFRVYDRIYATIYGQCVGDAIGLLTDGLTREESKKKYKEVLSKMELVHKKICPDNHRNRWRAGDWTDKTDQAVLIFHNLLHNFGEVETVDLAKRLMEWSDQGFPDLGDKGCEGLCSQVRAVCAHPQFSERPENAAEIVWRDSGRLQATNTAVARTSVLGIHQYNHVGKVIKNSLDVCRITHPDPRCQASCVAVSAAISMMLTREEKYVKKSGSYDIETVIDDAFTYASRCMIGLYAEIKELKHHMYCSSLKELKLDEPGKSNHTFKALGAGFWALRQKDFRMAIQSIILEGGDAGANAAVAGALLGCKVGLDELPSSWVERLLHRLWLDDIIDKYLDLMERKKRTKETTL
ncbi:hypothetical protein ScPMuIL_009434 [Solemya velum]